MAVILFSRMSSSHFCRKEVVHEIQYRPTKWLEDEPGGY